MNCIKTFRFVVAVLLWTGASAAAQTAPNFTFAPPATTGLAPYAVELADMDGDGDKDLITSNVVDQVSSTVSVSKNNGNGTFSAPMDYPVGPAPTDVRVADFNGDGKPDLVCIAALSGTHVNDLNSFVTVLFNDGTGGLGNRRDYGVGENAHSGAVDVADYNGDGHLDFAIASMMEGVHVYRNTGNGTFALWTQFGVSLSPGHIASADFNGDGRRDLVVGNVDAAQIFLNSGTGFSGGVYLDNYPDRVEGIATGDFDNDGQPDFAATGRSLSVYRNTGGGGSFAKTAYTAGENQVGIKTADMDGDGKLDITVSNYLANSVSVYSNDGTGLFADRRDWGVGYAPNGHGIADVNGDGRLDIVAAASQIDQNTVNVVLNAGQRLYIARRDYGMPGAAAGVEFADFNRDGYRDVVSGAYVSNQDGPFLFFGQADGTLQDAIRIENWGNNIPTDVAVGDFNGDGWLDFVTSIFSPGNCIRVNLNRGDGTFFPSVVYAAGGNPSGVGVGDLNADGRLDIVNSNGSQLDNSISVFIGNGNGTFQPQIRIPVGLRPGDVLLADFDRNGRSEVVVTHYGANAIYYFKPDAAGMLGTPEIINIGSSQGNAVAADFDNDTWLDLMVGAGTGVLLRNNQSGHFLPAIATAVPAGYIAAGDWDRDGLMDIAGSDGARNLVLVGWNRGGGNFTHVSSLQSGYETGRVGAADLTGDGLPEIVAGNSRARSISVFKNVTGAGPAPTPTPNPTATPNPTPVITPTPVASPTPTPVATPTPNISPTPSPNPTPTPPNATPTPPPNLTPTPTPTLTPTPTPSAPPSATPGGTPSPAPTATPTPPPLSKAINLSTRVRVQTGDSVGIGGFIITGTLPKRVLIRAIGPSLSGLGVLDAVADPTLELHGPGGFVTVTNDNWRDDPVQASLIAATGIAPASDLESAIETRLAPGAYTAIVRGKNDSTGVALVEVYDLEAETPSKLANLSTRAVVGSGDNIVIAGFILANSNSVDRVVVRGIGPSLTTAGVAGALSNPTLELRDSNGALLVANNDWQDDAAQASEISAAGLAPSSILESAIAATLPPGAYTALLAGRDNGTGIGVVEVYDRGTTP